ncbi:MAG: NAD(P)/FAD-dependent oxidoreductase [Candidatus Woesearchaeota archaeon]
MVDEINTNKVYDLLIVGGGVAGITAAIYAARKEMKFAIIAPEFGGEIMNTTFVENYPGFENISGIDLAEKFVSHMKHFNVEIIEDAVTEVTKEENFVVTTYGGKYFSKTLIWATGSKYKELGIPGEKEMLGRGITYCSICDGPLYKNKVVAVVGAGNNGLTSAIYMKTLAKKVYLISKYPSLKGDPVLVDKLLKDSNVEVIYSAKTLSVKGDKRVEAIMLDINGQQKELPVEGIIVNVGYNPIVEPVKNIVALNPFGYIDTDQKGMTKTQGFFAAGDVVYNPYKQLVISASDGCKAALGAYDYLTSAK